MAINSNVCLHLFTFALMTTGAFSRNIGKLFSELKLVTDNLLFTYCLTHILKSFLDSCTYTLDLASFTGHSQILSRSCGENPSFLHSCEIKSGSGLGTRLLWTDNEPTSMLLELFDCPRTSFWTLPGPVHEWFVAVPLARGMACTGAAESQ